MENVRRWMCAALAACVMLALLPATVWGADTEESAAAVVTANGTANTYSSLLEAAAAAQEQEGAVVKMLRSVDLGSETLTVTKGRFTLDLNGKSITAGDKKSQDMMGIWHTYSGTVLEITGEDTVSLTLVNSDSSNIAVLGLTGTNDGTVVDANNANAALTIGSADGTGGQIRLENTSSMSYSLNVWAGAVTCYTGIFPNIFLKNGENLKDLLPEGKAFHYCEADGTLVTSGWEYGIINGYDATAAGGSFTYLTVVPHEHAFFDKKCACGAAMGGECPHPEERIDWNDGPTCRRCQMVLEAQLTAAETKVFYPSLADAVAAAQEQAGCTVKLLKDVSLGANTLTVTKGRFTLDLNGKGITADEKKAGIIANPLLDSGTVLSVTGGAVQLVNSADNIATLALSCSEGSAVDVSGGKLTIGSKDGTGGQIRCKGGTMMSSPSLYWSGGTLKCYSGIFQGFSYPEGKQLRDALPAGKLFHYCNENGELQYRDDGGFSIGPGGPVEDDMILGGRYYITVTADTDYEPVSMGDVNGNGTVDVLDTACLYTYLTTGAAEKYRPEAADVNGDDTVDVYDLQMLYEFIAGLRTALPE